MGALILAILISLALGGVVFVAFSLKRMGDKYEEKYAFRPGASGLVLGVLSAFLVLGLQAIISSYTQVEYGTVAVITRFGELTGVVFHPGLNWKTPFIESALPYTTQKVTYETSENPAESHANYTDYEVDTTTADGQQIKVRYTVRFSIDPARVAWVAQNLGTVESAVEKVVKTDSRIHVRNVARQFPAADLYTGDVELYQTAVDARLRPIFEANGLLLDEVGIRSIVFTADYIEAVEQKQIAYEGITTARYQAEQEIHRKQATITKAEAEAQRLEIEAIGQAKALRAKGEALRENPEVLQLALIEKLGPNIKVILLPSGQQFILGEGVLGGP